MSIYVWEGNYGDQQAKGSYLDNGNNVPFVIRRSNPTEMIYMGGYRISDAPTYNEAEGKIAMEYLNVNGRNIVEEVPISSNYTKGIDMVLALPDKSINLTAIIRRNQDNFAYDIAIVPRNCLESCDEHFMLARNIRLGTPQVTTAMIGYDENEGPMNKTQAFKAQGGFLEYHGLEAETFSTIATGSEVTSVINYSEQCASNVCADDYLVRTTVDDSALPTAVTVDYTTDGGATWNAFDVTAVGTDIPVSVTQFEDRFIVPTTDDLTGASATVGKIFYADGIGGTLTLGTLSAASTGGLYTVESIGQTLYAFGGEVYRSTDKGVNWVAVTSPITETILCSAYDKYNRRIILGTTNGEVWTFNGSSFNELTGFTGTANVTSVAVTGENHIAAGDVNGVVYEIFNQATTAQAWDFSKTLNSGSKVGGIKSDEYGYRVVVVVGNKIFVRSLLSEQIYQEITNPEAANFLYLSVGETYQDQGVNAYFASTDNGHVMAIRACGRCFD